MQNNSLFTTLKLNNTTRFVSVVASASGIGKTTILAELANDLVNNNHKVLVICGDSPKIWSTMLNNLGLSAVNNIVIRNQGETTVN